MKKQLQIILVLFFTAYIAKAQIAVERFDYEAGTAIHNTANGGEGWAGPWEIFEGDETAMTIVAGADFTGIETAGNRLKGECTADAGVRSYRELATPVTDDGSTIWLSFIMEIENSGSVDDSWQGVSFWSPAGAGEINFFGKNWGVPNWGIIASQNGGTITSTDKVYTDGAAWLVFKVELSGDAEVEKSYIWVTPDPSSEPSTDAADATQDINVNDGFTHLACHMGMTTGIICYYDELMLGNTFDDVVPEAAEGIYKKNIATKNSSCYPNPFNISTTIDFNINSCELVKLEIYNVIGEKIETLMDGIQNPDNYKIQWNAEGQPSGIYFYKLQVGNNNTEMNKIILK